MNVEIEMKRRPGRLMRCPTGQDSEKCPAETTELRPHPHRKSSDFLLPPLAKAIGQLYYLPQQSSAGNSSAPPANMPIPNVREYDNARNRGQSNNHASGFPGDAVLTMS
jgi:hypothetical protein